MLRAASLTLVLAAAPAFAATPEEDIGVVLDSLHAAAAKADGPAYFALYAPDAVFIGTDVTERWSLPEFRAYAEPHFSKGKGWTYTPRTRHVTIAPVDCRCVAWFDEVLDSAGYGTTRGTGALVKTADGWKVSQYVLTFPIPNDIAKDITASIKAFEAKPKP
ncbi:protein with SnoaL 3 domain, NTF 2 superfamily [Caulobacter mirabilis]|uniref:Protein with SnoaL 3 domain, NTF 2 superfamily n=2 Tax=Caulobacter mirabilis TaxID=69666 RepID=A0A2D2B3W1_9CAUL|nr:protein with SnoaL 3 domain, NTF 2 superfamily [Caulobacter mirabilis]